MNSRQKIESAFSHHGTNEIPAVIPYDCIFVRDHYKEFPLPWWLMESSDVNDLFAYRRQPIEAIGQDWFQLWCISPWEQRNTYNIETQADCICKIEKTTGKKKLVSPPVIGGATLSPKCSQIPLNEKQIEEQIPLDDSYDAQTSLNDGSADLAKKLIEQYKSIYFPIYYINSPLWSCFQMWGFENTMVMTALQPSLLKFACRQMLAITKRTIKEAALLGAAGIWIEEAFTDMISPADYVSLSLPFVRELTEEIRKLGLKSIYYYCGSLDGRLEHILSAGADALAFEESKKNFEINIESIVSQVNGRCTVFGNLDAVRILQNGSRAQLESEIKRQIDAGRRNNGKFVMSIGSPVTPSTPINRVRQYIDFVHEYGRK